MPVALARFDSGFSLVELAVVLAIVGLLLGSLALPLSTQYEMRARRDTDKSLIDAREALIGHAIVKGRLPCPAPATTPAGTAGAGLEARNGSGCACTGSGNEAMLGGSACSTPNVTGVLPWASLGLPETDAWGRRYSYSVDARFARDPGQAIFGSGCAPDVPPKAAGFALCSPATLIIRTASGGGGLVSGGVPAVVASHGKNGYGAYTPQGQRLAIAGAVPDEIENANGNAVFVFNTNMDDQVAWVPLHLLMHRMLAAGMLP